MQVSAIIAELANQRPRSAWERGVVAYAESMLDELEPTEELWPRTVEKVLLNGAPSWHDYSWGGCPDLQLRHRRALVLTLRAPPQRQRLPSSQRP